MFFYVFSKFLSEISVIWRMQSGLLICFCMHLFRFEKAGIVSRDVSLCTCSFFTNQWLITFYWLLNVLNWYCIDKWFHYVLVAIYLTRSAISRTSLSFFAPNVEVSAFMIDNLVHRSSVLGESWCHGHTGCEHVSWTRWNGSRFFVYSYHMGRTVSITDAALPYGVPIDMTYFPVV